MDNRPSGRPLTAKQSRDTDSSESLSSWSATTEGGHHEEDAHWNSKRKKSQPKAKLGIPI
jgi:hypothetical protein